MIAINPQSLLRLFKLPIIWPCLLFLFGPISAIAQTNPPDSALVCPEFQFDNIAFFKVIANPEVGTTPLKDSLIVASLQIDPALQGFYRISALVHYENPNSRLQKNESFYLLVVGPDGSISYPLDANAGNLYKVVVDDSLVTAGSSVQDTTLLADAGTFFFRSGRNTIILYHYAKIAGQFPQFLICTAVDPAAPPNCVTGPGGIRRMNGRQSVEISIFLVAFDKLDLQLAHAARTDTTILIEDNRVPAVAAGDTFSYTLTFKNNGPRNTARGFFIADTIPAVLTPVFTRKPASRSQAEEDSVFVWKIDSLAVDAVDSITFEVYVPALFGAAPIRLFSSSQVVARCDTFSANNFASTTVYAIVAPPPPPVNYDLSHTQAASEDTVVAGEEYGYVLNVTNLGPQQALNFTLTDTLPALLKPEFIQRRPDARSRVGQDSVFVWNFTSLGVSADSVITFNVRVPASLPSTPLRLISRSLVSADGDTVSSNNFASTTVLVISPSDTSRGNYDLAHTQTASEDTVFTGEEYSYSLNVKNLGPRPALNFTLSDTIPSVLVSEFIQRRPDARSRVGQDSIFVWNFASLEVLSDSAITFNVRVPASLSSTPLPLFSRSFVDAAGDTVPANNFASTTVLVISPSDTSRGNYDLAHTQTASEDTVIAGDEYRYSLNVKNLGPRPALNFTLADTIPALLAPEFIQRAPDTRAQLGQDSVFVWNFASLDVQTDSAITFNVRVPASLSSTPLPLFSRSLVDATGDSVTSNNFASTTVLVISPSDTSRGNYDLAHTQTASKDTVFAGEEYSYSLNVKNLGPRPALNFTLADTIPGVLISEFIQRRPDARSRVGQDSIFVWNFASLAVLADSTVTFNVRVPASLPSTPLRLFSPSLVSAANDTVASNNFASTTVVAITAPPPPSGNYDLAHTQTASEDTVFAGEKYNYSLNVRNLGPRTALNFTLTDTLPALLAPEFIQRAPDVRAQLGQDSVFVWNFASLGVLADSTIAFNVRVPASLPSMPLSLFNRSLVSAANDTLTSNNFASTTVVVISSSDTSRGNYDLAHTQTASEDTVFTGEEYSYSLNVKNLGPRPALNFTLSDTLPALLTTEFIQRKPDTRTQLGQDSIFVWNFASLEVLADSVITFNVRVPDSLPSTPLRLFNRSLVSAADDTVTSNNFASTTVIAIPTPSLVSAGDCFLDRNVFDADREDKFGINFGLSASNVVRLDIYDLAGTHIVKLAEQRYDVGQQRFEWNGLAENGNKAGSGLYIVTIQSETLRCLLKFFVVR